ncbi:MAG: guanylate kinase [Lachnospiraceae bacterium]|nr:guanylate kinase [Lachnospiraceae bacterium]
MSEKGILLVISGFAGTGKGTVVKALMEAHPAYMLSVSMTTRAPREGEQEGVSYFFTTREEFEKTIAEGGLIEHASYVGNYYGTPRAFVEKQLAQGRNVILEIEIQGAKQVKEQYPDAVLVFITPPTARELERRLRGRGTETEDVIRKRLSRAAEEASRMEEYDYIVVNDVVETCAAQIHEIVQASRRRASACGELCSRIAEELQCYAQK